MISVDTVRRSAARLAHRRRDLSLTDLRDWFEILHCEETRLSADEEAWSAFRSAYFDSLWAGAHEVAPPPVVPQTSFPTGKRLAECAHMTLAFVASTRFELIDLSLDED